MESGRNNQINFNFLKRKEIIPFDEFTEFNEGKGFHYKGVKYVHHSDLHHSQSAFHRLSGLQILIIIDLLLVLILGFISNWHATFVIFIAVLTIVYFADLLFNLFLIYRSFSIPAEIKVTENDLKTKTDEFWPKYTVLCPLYKEWHVLPQFISAMCKLDYPKESLQVMLLLEEDDKETILQISKYQLPSFFNVVVVPHSLPKTKPKACNYGLRRATGDYIVIYDAEDIPDPLQLKKAVIAFDKAGERVVCIQAKLNFYNPHQNLLTKVFTAEYSLWFDLVLTGLQSIHAPIPLGGTSNHFKKENLYKLKGWDSFNVTEDCDLGMRLVKQGYQTAVVDSITLEEANSDMINWFGQRTRWIKGYIQTYFLHSRNLHEFSKNWKELHFLTFQLVVGGKVLSMLINPLMWIITISYFLFRAHIGTFIESFFPTPVLYMGVISLLFGNFLYMYYYMIGCAKHGHHELVKYAYLVPFYWLSISVAAWYATYRFIVSPHYWSKTKHGLHLNNNDSSIQKYASNGKFKNHENNDTSNHIMSNSLNDQPNVTIIILNFNGIDDTIKCLDSVIRTNYANFEIKVIDNGSLIDESKILSIKYSDTRIKFIRSNENYGFAGGNNKILKETSSKYSVLLNNDTQVDPNWLLELVRVAESDIKIAAVQSKIKSSKKNDYFDYAGASGGFIDKFGFPFARGRIFQSIEKDMGQYDDVIDIFWASGASILLRTDHVKDRGYLDETFFAYHEETDLCWRFKKAGLRVVCAPKSIIYHAGAASFNKCSAFRIYLIHRNMIIMCFKHLPYRYLFFRPLFDTASCIYYLKEKQISYIFSVIKSYVYLITHMESLLKLRKSQIQIEPTTINTIYNGSVVYSYYFKNKKKYSELEQYNEQTFNVKKVYEYEKNIFNHQRVSL